MRINSDVDGFERAARGFAQSGVRLANERAVLTLIALHPGSSSAELARLSGLGPQTVARLVAELETRELVTRGAVLRGRRGQPATPLSINPDGAYVIGVEIGWRHIEVLLLGLSGQVLASMRRSHDYPDLDTIFIQLGAEIAVIRADMTQHQADRLLGIGIASPIHLERDLGRLGAPADAVARWHGIDIAAELANVTGLPVEWSSEGNAACWSEFITRPEPRPNRLAYLQAGIFVGAGIFIDGALREASSHAANLGEIMASDADGQPATVNSVASLLALQSRLHAADHTLPLGDPLTWNWSDLEPMLSAWLDDAGRALAIAVVSTSAVIDVDVTVIDGVMPRPLVARLLERVEHHLTTLPGFANRRPMVAVGRRGGSAAAAGAAQLVLFRRFFSRAWNLFVT